MSTASLPLCTLEAFERDYADRHLIHGALRKWAAVKPDAIALINHNRNQQLTWRELERASTALAIALLELGFAKGDFLATSLPFLTEHVILEFACFQIGVIHTPLDLRLKPQEVLHSLAQIQAKGYAFLGATPAADFRELGRAVQAHCPFVRHLIQFSPPEETIPGAHCIAQLLAARPPAPEALRRLAQATAQVTPSDGAQVIFTTGSTGAPKAALLSHRGITAQNYCLGEAFGFAEDTRTLVNLPPSHVGGQAELLLTTLFQGGTAVLLEIFDAQKSLDAIARHRVNLLGQIPAMFHMQWRLKDYDNFDLSSLTKVAYGGQTASRPFLEKLASMAPRIATGLGLTEASGFCTYTPPDWGVEQIAESIGYAMPLYPMTIRRPMREDGSAGDPLPPGETGHICFRGPQTFSGYVNDPTATAKTISTDGYLYTGDLGFVDHRGLHFAGRAKWVIKAAGYQIFPGDVEDAICALDTKVAACGVVGAPHAIRGEAIIAFVEKKPGQQLDLAELKQHARNMAAYMRPLHFVVLEPGALPLNRTAKVDYVRLAEMAALEVERLREARKWDR